MAATKESAYLTLDRRGYRWKGERYARVSTIKGKKGSNALVDWAARTVAGRAREYAQQYLNGAASVEELCVRLCDDALGNVHNELRDEAADFGTVFHALVENVANGRQDALDAAAEAVGQKSQERLWADAEAFLDWTCRFQPKWGLTEFHVINRKHGYMGTADALVKIGDERILMDVKTSKNVYGDYALQLAAYRHAEHIVFADTGEERPMPEVDSCGVLHVRDGACTLYTLPAGDAEWEAFLACCRLYWYDRNAPPEFQPFTLGLLEAAK
jgi:hypothetical protein